MLSTCIVICETVCVCHFIKYLTMFQILQPYLPDGKENQLRYIIGDHLVVSIMYSFFIHTYSNYPWVKQNQILYLKVQIAA